MIGPQTGGPILAIARVLMPCLVVAFIVWLFWFSGTVR